MRSSLDRVRAARRQQDGFTLIELLIVIVILGVLAAVVVFSVRGITDRGDTSACKANYSTAVTAVEAFIANSPTGAKPASLAALVPDYLQSDPSAATVKESIRVGYTVAGGVTKGTAANC